MSENKFKFPTEEVELPSKGLLYSKDHPLKSGKIEMKYMTAKEEDILTNQNYTFRLLTDGIDKEIEAEIKGIQKINKGASPEISTRMKYIITSVEGDSSGKTIRDFVDTYLLARDAKALRDHVIKIQPDIELKATITNEYDELEEIDVPISLNFFFPDAN